MTTSIVLTEHTVAGAFVQGCVAIETCGIIVFVKRKHRLGSARVVRRLGVGTLGLRRSLGRSEREGERERERGRETGRERERERERGVEVANVEWGTTYCRPAARLGTMKPAAGEQIQQVAPEGAERGESETNIGKTIPTFRGDSNC